MSTKLGQLQTLVNLKDSEAIPLFHEKERLQTQINSLDAHKHWLENELASRTKEIQKLRSESSDRILQLQAQLDQTISEKDAMETRYEELRTVEHQLQQRITTLSKDVLNLQQEKTDLQETTELELQHERQLIEMQKEQIQKWEFRFKNINQEKEALQQKALEAATQHQQEMEEERKALEEKYEKILQEQVAEYEGRMLTEKASFEGGRRALPASVPQEDDEDNLMSLSTVDLYNRLKDTEENLRQERVRADRAEHTFQEMMRMIQAKDPEVRRQREEYEEAMDQIETLESLLEEERIRKEHAREACIEAQRENEKSRRENEELKIERQNLAKQCQAFLLKEAGGHVLSKEVPTSIKEIQDQNQRLVVETRRLTRELQEVKGRLEHDPVRKRLEEAEKEVREISSQREKQEKLVEKIVQERDLYRALVLQNDQNLLKDEQTALEVAREQSERSKRVEKRNNDLENDLAAVRGELDRNLREKEALMEQLARAEAVSKGDRESHGRLEGELIKSRSEAARIGAEKNHLQDRATRLEESLERSRKDTLGLEKVREELQKANTELEGQLLKYNSDRIAIESERDAISRKLRLAEARLEQTESEIKRLTSDNEHLRNERAQQGASMETVQRLESRILAQHEVEKQALRENIEKLENLVQSSRTSHQVELRTLESRVDELSTQLAGEKDLREQAVTNEIKAKKALLDVTREKDNIVEKLGNLEAQLLSAKRRLGEIDDGGDVEVALKARIDTLTTELDTARAERSTLEEKVVTYEKLAKDAESALDAVKKGTANLQSEQQGEIESLKHELLKAVQTNKAKDDLISELTRDLSAHRGEREKAEEALKAEITNLKAKLAGNSQVDESLKANFASLQEELESVRKEMLKSRDDYERELTLHAEARATLRKVREEHQEGGIRRRAAESRIMDLSSEIEALRDSLEKEKSLHEKTIEQLKNDLADSQKNAKNLHEQVETLGKLLDSKEATSEDLMTDEEENVEVVSLNKIRLEQKEQIAWLQNQNDILQNRLQSATRSIERERASYAAARRSLEEARQELKALEELETDQEKTAQYNELVKDLEGQVKILTDSNKLLRDELSRARNELSAARSEIASQETVVKPLEDIKNEFESRISSLEEEKDSLSRELDEWKRRVDSFRSKFNQVDAVEHKKTLEEVEKLKAQITQERESKEKIESMSNKMREVARMFKEKNSEQAQAIKGKDKEIIDSKAEIEKLKSQINTSALKEIQEAKAELAKIKLENKSLSAQLDAAEKNSGYLRETLRRSQATIKDLQKQKLKEAPVQATEDDAKLKEKKENPEDGTPKKAHEKIPKGGFKFGPSLPFVTTNETKTGIAKLNAGAPEFKPVVSTEPLKEQPPTKPMDVSSEKTSPLQAPKPKDESTSPSKTDEKEPAVRRSSGDTKQMSLKDKLLQKKKQLELQKKKRELEMKLEKAKAKVESGVIPDEEGKEDKNQPSTEAEKVPPFETGEESLHFETSAENEMEKRKSDTEETDGIEPEKKRQKTSGDPLTEVKPPEILEAPKDQPPEAANTEEASEDGEVNEAKVDDDEEVEVVEEAEDGEVEDDDEAIHQDNIEEEGADEDDDNNQAQDEEEPEPEETTEDPAPSNFKSPFGTTSSTASPFGSPFGQASGNPPAFGSPANLSGGGSSFSNMAPHGEGAPTFSFGSTANITLPTPSSTAPAPSPFDAFAASSFGGTAFGGGVSFFGAGPGNTGTTISSSPFGSSLFGGADQGATAPFLEPVQEENEDEEEETRGE